MSRRTRATRPGSRITYRLSGKRQGQAGSTRRGVREREVLCSVQQRATAGGPLELPCLCMDAQGLNPGLHSTGVSCCRCGVGMTRTRGRHRGQPQGRPRCGEAEGTRSDCYGAGRMRGPRSGAGVNTSCLTPAHGAEAYPVQASLERRPGRKGTHLDLH